MKDNTMHKSVVEPNAQHLIEIQDIGKDYQEGETTVQAIKQMNFFIDDGEFVSIMGQSGSGKSTLLSILGGLNHPSRGRILLDSLDIYELSSEQRADLRSEYIGVIFQSFQLIPYLTVLENVKLPMSITGRKAKEQDKMARDVLARVGLANKADRLPDKLSGGEQERVAIARAIVNKPPILLADEPTGNLDSTTADEIMNLLKELNAEGQTIIMVTHNPEACKHTARTIQVKDGSCSVN
ncbi:MAG: ABC transporter ATP-binding protein [Desulfobulbaceae bacterium]|jgi:putative ABC transport system ATP-binding protein|nr:ABC transporter ATP-binding protein [Desulfobulbaceae bacterium]MDH3781760.1 ABC transporter ATP-binding protein [Desulfobulbaceae bacterium]MDH3866654.1 ABC transporter ATP-binding protein [Desulfobulbaceae bacterium]MDH3996925.1 ABC transporter ATP-binding protein [Desulfobulbaceae bacterium]HKJ14391.1 ABC transporter ATP-binding protein [Desulfobulbales bacterium]